MNTGQQEFRNELLSALSEEELASVRPKLNPITMKLNEILYESGQEMYRVYFPETSMVSLIYVMDGGESAEIGVIGCEGMVGLSAVLGGISVSNRGLIQGEGDLYWMSAVDLKELMKKHQGFEDILLRFVQSLMTQVSQTAVCNQFHTIERKLCRWLLQSQDRLKDTQIKMTHEMLSLMIGARREGVTSALGKLAQRGLVTLDRGNITIIDREGMEDWSCECYQVVKDEHIRLRDLNRTHNHRLSQPAG